MVSLAFGAGAKARVGIADGTFVRDGILYGPKIGPNGPRVPLFSVWNQSVTGYCYETNTFSENLYAKWKARGVNCIKHQHPSFPTGTAGAAGIIAETEAQGLMMLASPRWNDAWGARPGAVDYRDLAINDDYWRINWIGYAALDEIDLYAFPLSDHIAFSEGNALGGVNKPHFLNLTRRTAAPATPEGTGSTNWKAALEVPLFMNLSQDSYQFHLTASSSNTATPNRSLPDYHLSTWNHYGIVNNALDISLRPGNRQAAGRRFTATWAGMATHLMMNGPLSPGRSDDGFNPPIYPPSLFNTPSGTTYGILMPPASLSYAPGSKASGHYVTTGRVDILGASYPRGGQWAPGRFLRDEIWSGYVHGSSHLLIFPQLVSSFVVQGYIDGPNNQLIVTTGPTVTFPSPIGGAMQITLDGGFTILGFIRKSNPQVSGTPGGVGTYALDPALRTSVTTGSSGSPVALRIFGAAGPSGDDTNAANASELSTGIANINRLAAHPTGGNLLLDAVNGGRRAFTTLRCPDIDGDAGLYREDMTQAPQQAGYTSGGVPILDDAGGGPMWEFGWPMGFEGFHVLGDDGARYIYVRSMSNGDRPTWFPGFAPLGLPARVFGAFETVGFRRVGTADAVEMTGTSAVLKAGVDDGAATWFYIESAPAAQDEGNSGTTTFNVVVRRGGNTSGTNAVTATVSGTGINPANATDFVGGAFPSQTLTFTAGETSKTFAVQVQGDTTAEQDETFAVTLSSPTNGAALVASGKSAVTCTITNDDAALVGAFVWLVRDLTAPPSLAGSPSTAVHLRASETSNVTRGGITMRSRSNQTAYDSGLFANVPGFLTSNSFHGVLLELAAGNWEIGFIAASASWGGGIGGNVLIIDDPNGAATVRQNVALSGSGALLMDSDGTQYTTSSTAIGDAVNALTFLPVTVSDLGGGTGLVQVRGGGSPAAVNIAAIAVRQA